MTLTPTLSHQKATPRNVCANGARSFVISNLGASGAIALSGIFYGAVNADGCTDRYFEFELTRPHCLANYFQDASSTMQYPVDRCCREVRPL